MATLTEEDIAQIIAENATLKARLKYYTGGGNGTNRERVPVKVTEKYRFLGEDVVTNLSWLIRFWLFKETYTEKTIHELRRDKKTGKYEPRKTVRGSLVSIKHMTDKQYSSYCEAFSQILDLLSKIKAELTEE